MKKIIISICLIIIFFLIFFSCNTYENFNFSVKKKGYMPQYIGPILFYDYNNTKIGTYPDDKIWSNFFEKKDNKYINLLGAGKPIDIKFPKSKKGPVGDKGYRGLDGDIGPTGSKGATITGQIGNVGHKGERGDRGDTGGCEICNKGDRGDKGNKGEEGDKGDQGDKGDRPLKSEAETGVVGEVGDMGPTGSLKGDIGEIGPIGNKGDKGLPGDVIATKGNSGILNPIINDDYLQINRQEDINSPRQITIGNNTSIINIDTDNVYINKNFCIEKNGIELCINKDDIKRLYDFNNPKCSCPNGIIVDKDKCTFNGVACKSCNPGFYREKTTVNGKFRNNIESTSCVACQACPPGQRRIGCNETSSGRCTQNTCKCNNGTKAKGTTCTTHNANICTHCNGGYRKSGNFCYKNTCKCNNGGEAKGTACTKHNTNICDRCDADYYLSGTECKECKSKSCPSTHYRSGWTCSNGATCKKKTDCGSLGIRKDATATSDNVCRSWQPAPRTWSTLYKEDNRGWGKYQSAWIESRKNNKTYAYAVHDNKVVWYKDHGYNNGNMRAPRNSAWMAKDSTTQRRYGGGIVKYSGDDFNCTQHGRKHGANNRTYYENDPNKKNNGICNDWGWSDTNTHYRELQYQDRKLE